MTQAFFLRVDAKDKEQEMLQLIHCVRNNSHSISNTFLVDPLLFQLVPNAPFAYWVSDPIRALFENLAQFEKPGLAARAGLCTGDDFRLVRLDWEVDHRSHASDQTRWVPFAKGGAFGRYYSDIYLRVNWHDNGREIVVGATTGTIPGARPQNVSYYFKPGITWPLRTTSDFGVRAMPAGTISGHKGPAAYVTPFSDQALLALLAICNSMAFKGLLSLQLAAVAAAARSYEVGVVQRTVVPQLVPDDTKRLATLAQTAWQIQRQRDDANETSHAFLLPALLRSKESLEEQLRRLTLIETERDGSLEDIQEKIDDLVFRLYGIAQQDRREFERMLSKDYEQVAPGEDRDQDDDVRAVSVAAYRKSLVEKLISYLLGVAFGRWDIRHAIGAITSPPLGTPFDPLPACSPGMLQSSRRSPAEAIDVNASYPIDIPWDGVLLDDPDHPLDIMRRVREVMELIWQEHADAIEAQACEILGVNSLRDYFRKASSGFFVSHLKRYSKSRRQAPIYWPLSTDSGSYTVWLHYPRFNNDTLYKALEHIKRKIAHEEQMYVNLNSEVGARSSKERRNGLAAQEAFLTELRSLYEEILRVVPLWRPNLDDGVLINYSLLWRTITSKSWQKTIKACWHRLVAGEYDWSHLAMHLWPDRVVLKCRSDRSLAIAHGLEDALWHEEGDGSWKPREVPTRPFDELVRERTSIAIKSALKNLLDAPDFRANGDRGRGGRVSGAASQLGAD